MYIFIFEDGTAMKGAEISMSDFDSVEAGILEIIDISVPDNPTSFYNGKWIPLESI